MPAELVMPKWGLTMREGLISRWLKQEGDAVAQGEPVLEVETEKMTNLVEAPAAGVLARILFPAGSTVAVTKPIAVIARPGETLPELGAPPVASEPRAAVAAKSKAAVAAESSAAGAAGTSAAGAEATSAAGAGTASAAGA